MHGSPLKRMHTTTHIAPYVRGYISRSRTRRNPLGSPTSAAIVCGM